MASIGWEGKRARIVFRDAKQKQKPLRLGECTKEDAKSALAGFKRVLQAHRLGTALHPDGVRWLERIDDTIYARVVRLGYAEPRKSADVVTLGDLLQRFDAASTVKPTTRAAYKQAIDSLRDHLKAETPLASITTAHADAWRKAIAGPKADPANPQAPPKTLAKATVAKRVHIARAIFKRAVRWGLIPSSPFADLRAGSQSNPDRSFYVAPESISAILAACPDDEWRAIVALSRYAGLRCPSEVVALRWGDVNWERGRLMVRSAKTEAHEGHAVRVVPIAPELRPILQDLYDRAEERVEPVLPRLRGAGVNLRTQFEKIIKRAGVAPWPRLFHNMRASCATDWVERFPAHVVAGWLGHSPLIAAQHYLQTRDAHFEMATGAGAAATNPATEARRGAPSDHHAKNKTPDISRDFVGVGAGFDPVESEQVGAVGFETSRYSQGNTRVSGSRGNKSGNNGGVFGDREGPVMPTDPELAAVVAAWPALPPAIRAAMLALAHAGTPMPTKGEGKA